MTVRLRNISGTEAAVGWAGPHTIVVDRPDGKAGGKGLGFNGGELLGLAIGGCFANDLQYVAHEMGIVLASIEIDVSVSLEGDPLLATHATMQVLVTADEKHVDLSLLVKRAEEGSTVSNSIRHGISVDVTQARPDK